MGADCRIHVLSDLLINKIAAGEVVERPASVVKELVENALDAQATRISVAIEDGGKQLIRVTDDGAGMSNDELRLAVMSHATSKIAAEDDLYAIETMGFRGEALASISSVSKLRIVSRLAGSEEGHEVCVAGEQLESSQSAGCPVGTTAEVRDLFFNVPARRKFLRSRSTEVGHINEQLARVALAHPRIGFELTNNGRVTQNLPACDTCLERVAKFYGAELASALMCIQREEREIGLEIYVAPPAQSRATTQWQYTYVNGRFIRDRFVQHAIKEAYRGLMEPNRHGVVFLFLTINPRHVDVNVHPTKTEVRWLDSNLIHSQVLSALRETFQRCDLTPTVNFKRAKEQIDPEEQNRLRREMADALKSMRPTQPSVDAGAGHAGASTSRSIGSPGRADLHSASPVTRSPTQVDAERMWKSLNAPPAAQDEPCEATPACSLPALTPEIRSPGRRPRAIQLHNLYLVAETEDGIVIVDQHALHERIMYEQLRERFTAGPLESQRLLLPETLKVTPHQQALLEESADLLEKLGVEVTAFGSDSIAVQAFPVLLKDTDVLDFMRDLLERLGQQGATTNTETVIHELLDMMACKAAVKAGDALTDDEIESMMRQRHLIEKSSSCPHGRPTMLRLTRADLDRQFKRV
ncbi:MAG: DNA mismatch repair endonuclease MutL [Phycisphaerales bacterium]|nr:MAG: DNA mismatch repair endonuclease MutL [Phycisphaerales bacterium]